MAAESIWPGMFQADAGRGNTASVRSTRDAISDTAASYAISHEQGARKKHSDDVAARKGRAARNSRRVICRTTEVRRFLAPQW